MSDASDESPPRWREDFPIQWEQDRYVTRRELAKFLTLGSALVAGANGAVALAERARAPRTFGPRVIARASELGPGQSLLFRYPTDDDPCILVRTRAGHLAAYSQVCTHLSCAVVYRPAADDLFCPCHMGVFECSAARPVAGPPERPLPRVAIEVRGDEVYALGVVEHEEGAP